MTDFEQIHQLKISLIEKGWDIEEKYSNDGFGKLVGYCIFARRCDWHGKFTYSLTGHIISFCEKSKNIYLENCYNYYVSQRNSLFHFGDVLNEASDNTRSINTKAEADEIIKNCIDLISTQQ